MATNNGMMGSDAAQRARQPQEVDPDDELFGSLVSGLRAHIFGQGEASIIEQLQQADDIGRVMGEITFALLRESMQQAQDQGAEPVWDVLIGAATEVIDDLAELATAHGLKVGDREREYALLFAQQLYVETSNPSPDERQAAQQQLGELKQGGEFDQAVSYVQQRGTEAGVDPFGVEQMQPRMMGQE